MESTPPLTASRIVSCCVKSLCPLIWFRNCCSTGQRYYCTQKSFVVLSKFLVNFGPTMRIASLIVFFTLLALTAAFAQNKVQLQKGAGKLIGGTRNGERIERVIDNVVF